tara:strand:- start:203 stop:487 length:285 start_codon:yes stop_codon:yes gene_type:complete
MANALDIMTPAELDMRVRRERAARTKDGLTVVSNASGITINGHYFIGWGRINTGEKLAGWLYHMAGKKWWDNLFSRDLIREAEAHCPGVVNHDV